MRPEIGRQLFEGGRLWALFTAWQLATWGEMDDLATPVGKETSPLLSQGGGSSAKSGELIGFSSQKILQHFQLCNFISGRVPKIREYQVTLYHDDGTDPYGFGLRVVGTTISDGNTGNEFSCARVLWVCPAGAAERGGIKVGDKVHH